MTHRQMITPPGPRLIMAGRGDSFAPFLLRALQARYPVVGEVDAELSQVQRLLSAAITFRPSRRAWIERFYKSELSVRLRSRNARRAVRALPEQYDVIFQTHALFELTGFQTVIYIDCTHRQSAEQWPDWNPLGPAALRRWYGRERRQYQAAAHLFAFSHETQQSLIQDYGVPAGRVTVVGAGLNFDELPDEPPARPTDLPPTVLFVGNDFVRKGGVQLLDAFRIVRESVPTARLRIAGTPYPIPAQPGVDVLGRIQSRQEMSNLYAQAHVFCLPSTFEPYGFVLLEAMAHGLPCVSTTTCGVPEIIIEAETGMMIARTGPGGTVNTADLAVALTNLLTHPERATQMGAAGRQRVQDTLLWSQVVDRMAPTLEHLPRTISLTDTARPTTD